jgi:type II secretory pathway pseudopilin PulG
MKHNKKNNKQFKKPEKNSGFTIIETLFSLLLISLALMSIAQMITTAIDAQKKSKIRFNMQQKIEYCRTQLVSKTFAAAELEEGSYSILGNPLKINWDIKNISPTLKLIHLSVLYKKITKKVYFYKSKYIKNNEPKEVIK